MSDEEKDGKKEMEVPEGGIPEWALRLQKSVDSLTKTLTERKEPEQITEPIVKVPVPQTPPEPEEMDESRGYAVSSRGGIAHAPAQERAVKRGKQMKTFGEEER